MAFLWIEWLMTILPNLWMFAGVITNSGTFLKPLCAKDEIMYLNLCKQGDKSARDILIERNLRLVAHVSKKYTASGFDSDDIISIGTIGLIKGINTFNPEKGTRLATYVAKCIDNEILMSLREDKKTKNEVLLNDTVGVDKEGNEVSLMEKISTGSDTIFDEVNLRLQVKELYEKMRDSLEKREREILGLRYGLGAGKVHTQSEIASGMGISRSYVSRIEKKAVEKLRDAFERDEMQQAKG